MVTSPHPSAAGSGTPGERPAHVADLLRLITREPGRPRLTWYGDDGERVELSGAVLENWINKTTNLLVEEFDAGPGTRVVIDLPAHWRTVIWALAVWRVGATAVLVDEDGATGAAEAPDVVVTARPGRWAGSRAELVAVSLPALARGFDGDLPAGAVDAASAVMTYGDQLGWVPEPDLDLPAVAGAAERDHAELLRPAEADATGGETAGAGHRELVAAAAEPLDGVLRTVVRLWASDGSAVLVQTLDATRLERIARDERVTA
ncbi:TIGR03089 family protein [Cellulosimicrobium sp. PMB13]|uniref:TIGR03089 family protein n=1 Tax=Cellulosimicrobium sp. PMB13 TaxID=3120158 RepID=UPI003F4B33D2